VSTRAAKWPVSASHNFDTPKLFDGIATDVYRS